MKRFYWTISLFGLMFLGYPEVAAVVGKHVVLLLNQLIGLYTCYSLVDTFHGVADFLYSCLEKINLTYLGALFVAEIGSMGIYAVYRLVFLLKMKTTHRHFTIKTPKVNKLYGCINGYTNKQRM